MLHIGYDAKRIFHNTTGLGNYGRDLVRIMSRYYPENIYHLYTPRPAKVHRLKLQNNMQVHLPGGFMHKLFPSLWRSRGILKDLQRDGIQIYHGLSGELPFGISKTGIPSVVTVHDLIFMRYPELYKPIDRKIYYKKFLRAVQEANLVVAISKQTKEDIIRFSQVNPEKIRVIYQGCHEVFKKAVPPEKLEAVREKYQLPGRFLIQVGTIEPRKNALTTVQALKDLPYHLVLVGRETTYAKTIRDFIQTHNMQRRVHFLQNLSLEELAALYRLAHVSVYPSIFEGFGIPIIESLYSGTPVITSRKGVFPEAAGPGGIYLDDVLNAEEMKEKITFAMESNLNEYIQAGQTYVKKFDDDKIAQEWMTLYQSMLSGQ